MFYHQRPLEHVAYGRVEPPGPAEEGDWLGVAYEWLGQYCGYHPQIWLARGRSAITGFRRSRVGKRRRDDLILFGFEGIQGFPVAYDFWGELLGPLVNAAGVAEANAAVVAFFEERAADSEWRSDAIAVTWRSSRDIGDVLGRHLFIEVDQVVVPALNLRAAKVLVCRSERQKMALRRLGFIEDRIEIRNVRRRD